MCLACAPVALRISRPNPPGCESEFGSRQVLLASSATLNTYEGCGMELGSRGFPDPV